MPELPEVETIARGLRATVVGRTVAQVDVRRADVVRCGSAEAVRALSGRAITAVDRRGKLLLIHIDRTRLAVHLGMSGRVCLHDPGEPTADHTHVILHLDDGRQIRHRDPRRFGFVAVARGGQRLACLEHLGPEPFDIDDPALRRILRAHDRQIKPMLLDQRVVAGIGNIYADEILFRSRVHPLTRSRSLGRRRAARLLQAMHETLLLAIDERGTSIRDYVTWAGRPGGMQRRLAVYGRAGQPCVRCGRAIRRVLVAQRGTHYCPKCQRRPA